MIGVCENSLGDFALVLLEKVLGAARTLASQHSKEVAPRKRKGPVRGSADAVGSAVTEDIIIALSQVSILFVIPVGHRPQRNLRLQGQAGESAAGGR